MLFESHPIMSLLETDLYKLSMGQAVLHHYPATTVRFTFRNRGEEKLGWMKPELDHELDWLCQLRFTEDELDWLRGIRWLSPDFIDYLSRFYLKRDQIHTGITDDGDLDIWAEGPWRDVMHFEIPVLATVSELRSKHMVADKIASDELDAEEEVLRMAYDRLEHSVGVFSRCAEFHPFTLADFGLRRRFSGCWQDEAIGRLAFELPGVFVGTSNLYLARKYGIKPIGTFAHEWFMGIQDGSVALSQVQSQALDVWAREYRGEMGIALSDIFGFRSFLDNFDLYYAKLFDGCRHDSGDPFVWGHELIRHYRKLGIDPRTKTGCWSDSLTAEKAAAIASEFSGLIKVSFGIGTHLVNNMGPELPPPNIVMKMTRSNGHPVAKISDSDGKGMCEDQAYVEYCKKEVGYRSLGEAR